MLIKNNNEIETYGATLNYNHRFNVVSFQALGTYEDNNSHEKNEGEIIYNRTYDYNYLSLSGILSFHLFNDRLIPAIFYNYSSKEISDSNSSNTTNRSGLGIDLQLSLPKYFAIYFGYSSFEQTDSRNPTAIELGARYKSENLNINFKVFSRTDFIPYQMLQYHEPVAPVVLNTDDVTGIGIIFNYSFWKLLLETNSAQ